MHKNGETLWLSTSGIPILDEREDLLGYRGADTDITERKQMEERLRRSEGRYRLLADNASDMIWTMDLESTLDLANAKLAYVSPSVEHIRGYTVQQVLNQNLKEILTPNSIQRASATLGETLQKEKSGQRVGGHILELEHYCKDGSTKWMECNMSFLRNEEGNPVRIMGVSRDITERKQAEETLKESEERFRAIAGTASEAIISTDNRGNIVYWNRAAEAHFGYSTNEVICKLVTITIPEQYRELFDRGLDEVVSSGSASLAGLSIEGEGLRKDGSIFPCVFSLATWEMRGENFFTAIVSDLTERKRLQEEHQKIEKLESIGTPAGGIAHDFNNILTGIMGNISLARRDVEPKARRRKDCWKRRKHPCRQGI